jgi:hypothetical protein
MTVIDLRTETETRIYEWGVMDSNGRITECPGEQDACAYQAAHGGELVSRVPIHASWLGTTRRIRGWLPVREVQPRARFATPVND